MANQTPLRQLAKDHAQGSLDKDSYRKSRAEFLQQLVAGEITLEEIDYPPPVKTPEPEPLDTTERREEVKRPAKPAVEAPADAAPATAAGDVAPEEQGSNRGIFIGIAIAVLVVVFLAFSFMAEDEQEQGTTRPGAATQRGPEKPVAATSVEKAGGEAQQLIESFLEKNNWSTDSLQQFQQDWNDLANDELAAAENSPVLGKMTNAIYRQLLEEQALAGLVDDDSSLNKQKQLVEFANSLGIEDSRFKLPDPPQP